MSCLYTGPRAGSYKPSRLGLFKSSRRTGFVICLTEIRRISLVVRIEKDTLWTVEKIGNEIFMMKNPRIRRDDLFRGPHQHCRFPASARRAGHHKDHVTENDQRSKFKDGTVQYSTVHTLYSHMYQRLIRLCHSHVVRALCLRLPSSSAPPQPVPR